VEKQAFFGGFYSDADGLPDGSEYPAEALRQAQCDSRAQICGGVVANSRYRSPDLHFC